MKVTSGAEELLGRIGRKDVVCGVVGLGYVGLPLAYELARAGFRVIGFDISERTVESVNSGVSHIRDVKSETLAEEGVHLRLTARGRAGHGSMVNDDNAVTTLAAAVARIGAHRWPVRLTPAMRTLLAAVGELAGTEATPENAEDLVEEFGGAARMMGAVIRNTCNPTMFDAGYKVNVIPTEATAHVDGRFLPGFEDEFFATIAALVGEGIDIDYVSKQPPWETPYQGDLVDAMTRSLLAEDEEAIVAPYLMSGGTDAKHFRRLGMRSYGFAPLRLPADLDFTALFHGVDERVPVDALGFGARVFDRFLDEV